MALLLACFACLLPTVPEEWALARLPGQWDLIETNSADTCPSGLSWSLKGGSGSGGYFATLTIARGSRKLVSWSGNCDELPPYLRIYRDRNSGEPRFLCYQPLSIGPHTLPGEVCPGFCLIEGATVRPILTQPLSLFWRDPVACLLGWGPSPSDLNSRYGNYSAESGLLDQP